MFRKLLCYLGFHDYWKAECLTVEIYNYSTVVTHLMVLVLIPVLMISLLCLDISKLSPLVKSVVVLSILIGYIVAVFIEMAILDSFYRLFNKSVTHQNAWGRKTVETVSIKPLKKKHYINGSCIYCLHKIYQKNRYEEKQARKEERQRLKQLREKEEQDYIALLKERAQEDWSNNEN